MKNHAKNNMNILAIIPARCGSKSVPDKNIRLLNGKPMLAYSIEHALSSNKINRIIVSSDSEEYQKIAKEYGAEAPFLRPEKFSNDGSLDIEAFQHALEWLKEKEQYVPDIIVHLRPTYPIRDYRDIDKMIEILENTSELDSVKSLSKTHETPYRMWKYEKKESANITPLLEDSIPGIYNTIPRQAIPTTYIQNCSIDVIRADVIGKYNNMTGYNIAGYNMLYDFDIDYEMDFLKAEKILNIISAKEKKENISIGVSFEEFIVYQAGAIEQCNNYPKKENIEFLNELFKRGKIIKIFYDSLETKYQKSEIIDILRKWGVMYSALSKEKPDDCIYIDCSFMGYRDILFY